MGWVLNIRFPSNINICQQYDTIAPVINISAENYHPFPFRGARRPILGIR